MGDPKLIKDVLSSINDNNVYKFKYDNNVNSNDNNDVAIKKKKYALNREKFTPNTEETQLAEEIASSFSDLDNYAFYLRVVNKLGVHEARSFWKSHEEEEDEKRGTRYEIRKPKQYFAWKFKKGLR